MSTLIHLEDHMKQSVKRKVDKPTFKWSGEEFYLKSGKYFDRAKRPLIDSDTNLSPIRKRLLTTLPRENMSTPSCKKVFMPFVQSGASFWISGIIQGAWNNMYAPFMIVHYIMRDHKQELIDICDGVVIENEKDYNRLSGLFNKIFLRVLNGGGSGTIRGYCSEDEMIRMGSLFYMIQRACSYKNGLQIDKERRFMNKFCGKRIQIDIDHTQFDQYSKKLQGVVFSDMNWKKFMMRYMENTGEDTLWLFNVPKIVDTTYRDITCHHYLKRSELIDIIDMLSLINNRGGKAIIIIRKEQELLSKIESLFGFNYFSDNIMKNSKQLFLYKRFAEGIDKYSAISNYSFQGLHDIQD